MWSFARRKTVAEVMPGIKISLGMACGIMLCLMNKAVTGTPNKYNNTSLAPEPVTFVSRMISLSMFWYSSGVNDFDPLSMWYFWKFEMKNALSFY